MSAAQAQVEMVTGVLSWMVCSVGMLVFNKFAIKAFPVECTLVALQMGFTVLAMVVFCGRSIHIGSKNDVLRWMRVVPFFTGMLLTSILALKHAPMSLVVVFRVLSPLLGMFMERQFFPTPMKVSKHMLFSILIMLAGTGLYCSKLTGTSLHGIGWVIVNNFFAIGDRLFQRLMLAKDQEPVDISKTGVTLLNNLLGMIPLLVVAALKHEVAEVMPAVHHLDHAGIFWVLSSCVVGVGISYTGIWAQSLISATSFLVLVNANKFLIILFEGVALGTKSLYAVQSVGAVITILGGVYYGKAREALEIEEKKLEIPIANQPQSNTMHRA